MEEKIYGYTDFNTAIKWFGNNFVNINNLRKIEPSFDRKIRRKYEKNGNKICQTLISDCSDNETEYLKKTFGLKFEHSVLLKKHILLVNHIDTDWNHIKQPIYSQEWWEQNKNKTTHFLHSYIEASTINISQQTYKKLLQDSCRYEGIFTREYEYGLYIYITQQTTPEKKEKLPSDLKKLIEFAEKAKADLIIIDRDCSPIKELEVFEWN